MKIQYCSDLHIEFEHNSKYLVSNPLKVSGDILILAGDIIPLQDSLLNNDFFAYISERYEKVFWVPGNHEFYHRNLNDYSFSFNIQIRNNIHIVNNVDFDYNGIRFIFSTLWSNISKNRAKVIEQCVADFTYITIKDKAIKVDDYNKLHVDSLNYIKQAIAASTDKTVVVTHHLPSEECNAPEHRNSLINEAFCTDLTTYISSSNANFWIYGHSHFNQKPLFIGNTVLLTNQLGMVKSGEHLKFKSNAFFSI